MEIYFCASALARTFAALSAFVERLLHAKVRVFVVGSFGGKRRRRASCFPRTFRFLRQREDARVTRLS